MPGLDGYSERRWQVDGSLSGCGGSLQEGSNHHLEKLSADGLEVLRRLLQARSVLGSDLLVLGSVLLVPCRVCLSHVDTADVGVDLRLHVDRALGRRLHLLVCVLDGLRSPLLRLPDLLHSLLEGYA